MALRTFGGEPEDIHWSMIRTAMKSRAALAIIPAQDVLGLGNEARMNRPGVPQGNWVWRMEGGRMERGNPGETLEYDAAQRPRA